MTFLEMLRVIKKAIKNKYKIKYKLHGVPVTEKEFLYLQKKERTIKEYLDFFASKGISKEELIKLNYEENQKIEEERR